MSDEAGGRVDNGGGEGEEGKEEREEREVNGGNDTQDQTEILLHKVSDILREKCVNYAIIINDGASPRWIISDVYWAMGVFMLIRRNIEAGWDMDMLDCDEEDEDDDG